MVEVVSIEEAGYFLGAEQSGFITDIGFEMYTKILDDAVRELKETEFSSMFSSEPKPVELPETQVEFDYSAYLENSYVQDNVERLNLYRKLSEASTLEQIDDWSEELEDRFGELTESAGYLVLATKIKLLAARLLVKKVTIRADRMWLQFPKSSSELGEQFYGSGYFQKLLKEVENIEGHKFEVVQKKDSVRLVIHNIGNPEEAADYLNRHEAFENQPEEVPA